MFSETLSRMKQENSEKDCRIAELLADLKNKENTAFKFEK